MFTAIASILAGPFVNGAVDAYKAKLDSGNTKERIAADLAGRELAVEQREAEVNAEYKRALIGHWYEPINLIGYIIVIYIAKVVVWDSMLGWGSTPAVRGAVGEWMGLVVLFLVGKRTTENVVGRIWGR